ncbi:dynamin family protein [Streptomyces sp. NPDC052095]|uniref:dynamin family protein n=1 Tax=unclassified Streptomyces TaxID=2593676 RepID=UPI00344F0D45
MTVPQDLNEVRDELRTVLDRCVEWLRAAADAPETPAAWPEEAREDARTMTRLRTRAASTLINVALLGSFSSGKSFLLSGLQGGLELVEVPTADGRTADKFVGLLPSSPVPTTACPASVVPVDGQSGVDASGTGYLRVRFTDSGEEWEDVGNSPAPSVVAAYAMQDASMTDRLRPHRGREVAELEIMLDSARLPAKLHDLPGYGSPNPVHDMIVRTAMADADCFMYVSHASRTLSERDLDLIRFLYDHYLLSGKRVVWVVTAIDAASHLDLRDIPEWKATITRNNAYLRENFTLPTGQPDLGFIGEGFLPVSPALEARAARLDAGDAREAAQRQRAESRMETLRQAIEDLISTGTGVRHIAAVAREARILVAPRHQALDRRLREERLEIDELKELLRSEEQRMELLDTAVPRMREELERRLRNRIARAVRPFTRLPAHLHAELDDVIRATDLTKPTRANQVQVQKAQLLHAWIEGPGGPATLWTEEFEGFKKDLVQAVERVLGDKDIAGRLPDFALDVNSLLEPPRQGRGATTRQDVVQRAAALVGIVTPVAAGGGWLYGLATAGTIFPPAGFVAGIAALVFLGVQRRKGNASSLQVLQGEWIDAMEGEVASVEEQFTLATGVRGADLIDYLMDNLVQYREQLEQSRDRIGERIMNPENQVRQGLVDQLEPLCVEAAGLLGSLQALEAP